MKRKKNFLISSEATDIFPVCLISPRPYSVQVERMVRPQRDHTGRLQGMLFPLSETYRRYRISVNIIENHDEPRGVSHYIPDGDLSLQSKKFLAAMYFMLRGLPFIYQGQEIGMENLTFTSIDQVDDISSIDEYHVALDAGCTEKSSRLCLQIQP